MKKAPWYENLREQGVVLIQRLIPSDLAAEIRSSLVSQVEMCAEDLDCELADYLSSVSRWVNPSPLVTPLLTAIQQVIQLTLEKYLEIPLAFVKANVITKNQYSPYAVAAHQDSAYQTENTDYDFTAWIALSPIAIQDGPLECLPYSHRHEIQPAVDFWQPNFSDTVRHSERWRLYALSYCINAGDAVLFDANTWHASGENQSQHPRYALVTRWRLIQEKIKIKTPIPPKKIQGFGLWNCHTITQSLLTSALGEKGLQPKNDFIDLVNLAQKYLIDFIPEKGRNSNKALQALKFVKILHQANEKHNGGDSQGKVYANLWLNLLRYLPHAETILTVNSI